MRDRPFNQREYVDGDQGESQSVGLGRADEAIQEGSQFGRIGDLFEAEDRHGELLECFLVDLEPIGDRQHEPGRAVAREQTRQPFQARSFPEPDDFDEHVITGWRVHQPVIGNPDPFASQFDDVGALADLPGGRDLAEPLDKRLELDRGVCAGIGLMRHQAVARFEEEAPRLALRAPPQLGFEPEIRAMQERRQEERDLQAVLGGGAEEA